ncbi:cell envelope integrity TolA C-terminal domain-containing protein [Klebsiella pneumoniae]
MIKTALVLAIVSMVITGCAPLKPTGCHKLRATDSCNTVRWNDQDEWALQARKMRAAINARLDNPEKWKGKQCWLVVGLAPDGTTTNITTGEGNKDYCAAIKAAAEKATFPAFSRPELLKNIAAFNLDMYGSDQ